MDYIVVIGLIAATLTAASYLPQVVKVIKTKKTRDFSLLWLLVLISGMVLWLIYSFLVDSVPLFISTVATITFLSIIISYKLRE
jgi:MtN3 and saliva related transmembrane protein